MMDQITSRINVILAAMKSWKKILKFKSKAYFGIVLSVLSIQNVKAQVAAERIDFFMGASAYLDASSDLGNLLEPSIFAAGRFYFELDPLFYVGLEFHVLENRVDEASVFEKLILPIDAQKELQMDFSSIGLGMVLRSREFKIRENFGLEFGVSGGIEFVNLNGYEFTFFPNDPLMAGFESERVSLNSTAPFKAPGIYSSAFFTLKYNIASVTNVKVDLISNGNLRYSNFTIDAEYLSQKDSGPLLQANYTTPYQTLAFDLTFGFAIYWKQ